jgi:hypothetical protein
MVPVGKSDLLNQRRILVTRPRADPTPLAIAKIMGDNIKFSPTASRGLELVDIVTNATRRALSGHLQQSGWARIPELMIHRGNHYISMVTLEDDPESNRKYPNWETLIAYGKGGRVMLPSHLRNA